MRKVTIWEPDTCTCVLEIHWDTDDPPDARVHEFKMRKPCEHHQGADGAARARADNSLKCEVMAAAGEDAGWHFTSSRGLVVDCAAERQEAVQAVADAYHRAVIIAQR